MRMHTYVSIPMLALLAGCSSPSAQVESKLAIDKQPSYEVQELKRDVNGSTKKTRDELEKDVKSIADAMAADKPNGPDWTQTLEYSSSDKTYRINVRRESGWLPEKYVKMLNEARDKDYLMSYDFYADGASHNDKTALKRPIAVGRKNDGTYVFFVYESGDDGQLNLGMPVINVIKYNDPDSLGKAIRGKKGIARTNWPKPPDHKDGEIIKNPRVRIRTNKGIKEIVAPYALQTKEKTIVIIDEELKRYLKDDELPKYYAVLKE